MVQQVAYTPNIQHMPFDFSAVSGTVGSNIAICDNFQGRGDFLVREIMTWNSAGMDAYDLYRLQIETLVDRASLWSNPVGQGCIQTDAQEPWMLPTPWLLPRDKIVRATLINMTGTFQGGSATNVTTQHVLIGEIVPEGSYVPAKIPYGFTYYFNVGFGEDFTSGGNVSDTYNLYPSFKQGLPPLLWDFELCSITLDTLNITVGDIGSLARFHKIQIFDRNKNKDLFSVPAISGNVCGGRVEQSLDAANLSDPTGFPVNDVMQYWLPEPVIFKKGTQLSIKLSYCLLWAGSQSALSDLNQPVTLLLMGNKING
jgi:hypothetical protein